MGSLTAALGTAGNALDVLEQAIGVVQNNVTNASTPGYVTQTLNLTASPFDARNGVWGGVSASGVQSARQVYAEQAVWSANSQAGLATQEATSLSALQNNFDVSGTSGVAAGLSALNSAFSAWSSNPTDTTARQQVLTAAQTLSGDFNTTAANVQQLSTQTDQQLSSTVSQINAYASQIAAINGKIRQGGQNDAGLQTQLYNTLEQLSNLAPIQVQTESDHTATVLLGGQSPLVIGQQSNALQLSYTAPAGVGLAGNSQALAAPGATFVVGAPGTDDETFNFNVYSGGSAPVPVTATVAASAAGQPLSSVLASLNAQLNPSGITAGLDSNGRLQFSGTAAFTVNDSPASTGTQLLTNDAGTGTGAAYPAATPDATLLSADGRDVTALASQGELGGLLNFRNVAIPSVIGDPSQQGSLNQLAEVVANRVNTLLASGEQSSASTAADGVALFAYDATNPTSAASTLALNPGSTAANLAAIDPVTGSANGVASTLAGLSTSAQAADQIGGLTYSGFYSSIASGIGAQQSNASAAQATQTQALTQAQTLRAQVSGVSLNDQATQLLQFQQAYQASAQVISTINNITQSLLTTFQNMAG